MSTIAQLFGLEELQSMAVPILIVSPEKPNIPVDIYINGGPFELQLIPYLTARKPKRIWLQCKEVLDWAGHLTEERNVYISRTFLKSWRWKRDGILMGA